MLMPKESISIQVEDTGKGLSGDPCGILMPVSEERQHEEGPGLVLHLSWYRMKKHRIVASKTTSKSPI